MSNPTALWMLNISIKRTLFNWGKSYYIQIWLQSFRTLKPWCQSRIWVRSIKRIQYLWHLNSSDKNLEGGSAKKVSDTTDTTDGQEDGWVRGQCWNWSCAWNARNIVQDTGAGPPKLHLWNCWYAMQVSSAWIDNLDDRALKYKVCWGKHFLSCQD